jgi:hypothetical protein
MPPLKLFSYTRILFTALCCVQLYSINLQATEFEVTSMIGQNFSPDLSSTSNTANAMPTDNAPHIALGFAWQDSPNGQGQILINYISRDFTDEIDQSSHSFDTLYAHFNGVALFKEKNYVTTVSLGIGATYFNSDFDDVLYPSMTAAIGTRYEFSDRWALVTELRGYATLTDNDDTLFCEESSCIAYFDDSIWFDTQISIGVAYTF